MVVNHVHALESGTGILTLSQGCFLGKSPLHLFRFWLAEKAGSEPSLGHGANVTVTLVRDSSPPPPPLPRLLPAPWWLLEAGEGRAEGRL